MKTKTLKQINNQVANILCAIVNSQTMSVPTQVERMKRVRAIANRYRRNATAYIKASGINVDMFGYLPVSAEIYMR